MHDRERDRRRREGLPRDREHDRRILAAREQQTRPRHLRGHLAEDEDALGLEGAEVAQDVGLQGGLCGPRSDGGPKVSSRRDSRPGMTFDLPLAFGGLLVGIIVGLTGMGGGALMTPMLVFFFGADPLPALSRDLVASFVMKPAGALVHLRAKTVNVGLVKLLVVGSVPAAFFGAWFISLQPRGDDLNNLLKVLLGVALLVAAGGLVLRALFQMWQNALPLGEGAAKPSRPDVVLRPVPTIVLGAVAGFIVGITSVGSGSIIVVALLMIYPGLKASSLVGTDLTQAIPLVAAAALGHLLFGRFDANITAS